MGGNTDEAKGRVKQAVGALTGDEKLQRDGRRDERVGEIKKKADEVIDTARDKVEDLVDKVRPDEKE